jgi:hypothetical protein
VPAGLVLAAALTAGAAPADAPARPVLASYEVTESARTVTPAGERTAGLAGSVRVSGGRARWELPHGAFPRSSASVVIASGTGMTLLAPRERLAAQASEDDFASLFRGRPAPEGSAAVSQRDVAATLTPEGSGRSFEGRPSSKFLLEARWTIVLATSGLVSRVTTEVRGVIETVHEPAAQSSFDALGRLLPARGEAAEALDAALAKLRGFPVSVALDVTSKAVSEQAGMPSTSEPPRRPVETRRSVSRRVAGLSVRAGSPADDALFAVPEDFHTRGLERLAPGAEMP